MRREIKFRAWDTENEEWVAVSMAWSDDKHGPISTPVVFEGRGKCVIQQYTGLKDKNGVEIYEGDIIKYITQYYGNKVERQKVVEWIDDMQDDSFGEPLSMGYRFHGGDIEVIGNIYENPELLTSKGER